ncbi:MAG: hypothetical protein V4692_06975, partial [Bdellovibrionota bacterium]
KIDGDAGADADKQAQDERAKAMEKDLGRIQNFYQGVRGIYEGRMETPAGRKYRVRLNIHPTIERYEGSRIRTPDEITYDLTNVAFDVAENTYAKMDDGSELAFNCKFSSIRPGVDRGFFTLEDEGCGRMFAVNLVANDSKIEKNLNRLEVTSRQAAADLLSEELDQITRMQVEMRSVNLPDPIVFMVERVR